MEQLEHKWGSFSTMPSGKPDFVDRADISDLISACMDALEQIKLDEDLEVEAFHPSAALQEDKQRFKKWTNVVGVPDRKRKEIHSFQLRNQAQEAVYKENISSARDKVHVDQNWRTQSRNRAEFYDEPFTDIPGLLRDKTENKNKASFLTSARGGFGLSCCFPDP
ncbi:hypothetical protein K458DRAFT_395327 [Lentithecium fluviatile CBS 122367]|uniref:Uncharacterized protein n=1 Tax=Lentithecium fluviatile CBS 122367 TaxID=1168545 RepID=A0A6G1IIV9_9PLEO|nr:hypothetical protein K458DRAFT_395327 [Lentithecium fluviatile CBS 122367]